MLLLASNAIPLLTGFRLCDLLIRFCWCPRFFAFRCRDTSDFSRMRFSARIVTEDRAALLPFETTTAIRTLAQRGTLFGLVTVAEEGCVPADGRAVDLWSGSEGIAHGLIQQLSAGVTLLGEVETLRPNVYDLSIGEFHATLGPEPALTAR